MLIDTARRNSQKEWVFKVLCEKSKNPDRLATKATLNGRFIAQQHAAAIGPPAVVDHITQIFGGPEKDAHLILDRWA